MPLARRSRSTTSEAICVMGRAGNFGYVVGVDRVGRNHADELQAGGADIVVQDLSELLA